MSDSQIAPAFQHRRSSAFEAVATFAILAGLLYLGAGIFVPLVLAILLAFALNPLVSWLNRRLHLPDPIAVIVAVLIAVLALGTFAFFAGTQIGKLALELPGYQQTIAGKVQSLQNQFGDIGWLEQVNGLLANVGNSGALDASAEIGRVKPIPVTISNDIGPLSILSSLAGSIIGPVATIAIVTVFLIFLLMGRADLQDRFIRLVSAGRYSLTNLAITDASRRVGRYLITQLLVNVIYGTIFGIGLWLIGVPSAPLWGLLIVLFRYIPFVGALIIAVVPFALAFAVDPGWNMLIMSVALFLVIDLTTANVIEPRLYGSSTGVSAIAILLSAMFWATLWGPVGLILATPMTVCLVVIGRHLPQFQFLETLLGSEPVLSPSERLYQRMLKGDTEDAIDLSEDFIEENDKEAYAREVMLPALRMATGELADRPESLPQRRRLIDSFEAVIEATFEPEWTEQAELLIIGGRTEIDEAAARLLGLELTEDVSSINILPPAAIRQESIGRLDLERVQTVVLVFMGSDIRAQCRYVARRIRRMNPDVRIDVVTLNPLITDETSDGLHVDTVYHDFFDAKDAIIERQIPAVGKVERAHQPFAGLGRGDDELGRALDEIAEKFDMPAALINLVDDERHEDDEAAYALTKLVTESEEPIIVHSSEPNIAVGENAYLQTNGIDFYAGVPLVLPDGSKVGALAVMDYDPRRFSEDELEQLKAEAAKLVERFG
jgi:predicted PurR-regulated permease PerM/GAF domain-containing protein